MANPIAANNHPNSNNNPGGFVSPYNVAHGFQRPPGYINPNSNLSSSPITVVGGGTGTAVEPTVISSVQGKNVLDTHTQNQNNDVNTLKSNSPLNQQKITPPVVPGQPPPAPKTNTTKSDAMKSAGGVTADEAKATGIDLSQGYTYDQQTGYFMPSSSSNTPIAPYSTPEAVNAKYQKQIDDANSVFKTMIGGMDSGTQSLISSLNAIYQDRIKAQTAVNANEEASINTMNIRGGTSRYAGGVAQSIMTADENAGLDRIKTISNELADKIATASDNLQNKKYSAFIDNRNEIDKLKAAQTSELKDLHDEAVTAAKDQRDFKYKQDQDKKNYDLEINKYDLSVANSKVDNAYKRAETQKILNDLKPADKSAVQSWVQDIKNNTAKLTDVPESLKSAVAIGLANGGQNTNDLLLTSQKSLQELNDMVNQGPGILGNVYNTVKNAIPGVGGLLPNVGTGFTSAVGAKGASSFFGLKEKPIAGTEASNFDLKLNQVKNDVIIPNLNLLHGLGRVTDREFQALSAAVTSLSTDQSEEAFKSELKNITDRINQKIQDNQSSVIGDNIRTAMQNKFTPDQIISTYMQDPNMAPKIQAMKNAKDVNGNPAPYTNEEIVNYFLTK